MKDRTTPNMGQAAFRIGDASDDAGLRRLLRDNPVPGSFSLALVREPDFFMGAEIEGDVTHTVVACEEGSDRLLGLGGRAVRTAWINGERARLGYFGQLRIDRDARGRKGLLIGGFDALRELWKEGETPFLVTTIIQGNAAATRALTSGRPGMPTYVPRDVLCTLALSLRRRRSIPRCPGIELRRACGDHLEDVARCLRRNYRRFQFAPVWTADDLADERRCRGLLPGDFVIALRGGDLVGCLATWDQSSFKQTVVHGYPPALRLFRPLVNLVGPLTGLPHLPPVGRTLPHAYFSHIAADGDDPDVLVAMMTRAFNDALGRGWSYVTLAFAEGNPMLHAVKAAFRHIEYRSRIYLVHWEEGRAAVDAVDDRIPHLELAVL
ncbi:MAG: hypothetical protein GXP54_07085 [Deltaproteobacteria bacterium]|nr:hypothetical protein [Deltaproteobacteria bacterium]